MAREFRVTDVSVPERGILATLHERVDGGPMRTAANVSQKRAVGRYASQKNGRGQFWESRNELNALYGAEVSTPVVKYRAQPHTLDIVIDGKKRSYTPDREDILSGPSMEIIEIKHAYDATKDPFYDAKLALAREVYASLGWSFRIDEREQIEAQPRFKAVTHIQRFRRTLVTQIDEDRVCNHLMQGEVLTLAEVRSLWDNPVLGFAKMCALMVRRTIDIELDCGLSDTSLVRLVSA